MILRNRSAVLFAPYIIRQPDNHLLVSHTGFVTIKFKDRLSVKLSINLHERERLISKLFAKRFMPYTILIPMLNI